MLFSLFTAKKMRKIAEKRIRQKQRDSFMELYGELKRLIKVRAKKGVRELKFFVSPYDRKKMLLWRFFRRKHKDFKVNVFVSETNGGFIPHNDKEAEIVTEYRIEISW